MWPDVGIKSGQVFPKTCPKSSHSSFYFKCDPFRNSSESILIHGRILHKNLSPRTFKTRPIWSHWVDESVQRKFELKWRTPFPFTPKTAYRHLSASSRALFSFYGSFISRPWILPDEANVLLTFYLCWHLIQEATNFSEAYLCNGE